MSRFLYMVACQLFYLVVSMVIFAIAFRGFALNVIVICLEYKMATENTPSISERPSSHFMCLLNKKPLLCFE